MKGRSKWNYDARRGGSRYVYYGQGCGIGGTGEMKDEDVWLSCHNRNGGS